MWKVKYNHLKMKNLTRSQKTIIIGIGIATFFFGFLAPGILNLYLLSNHSALVLHFRSSLNYISSILGDGIILPVVNMVIAHFIFRNQLFVNTLMISLSLLLGAITTLYFHTVQAVEGLINWAMPKPWHWNFLGFWHAVYMFSLASLICFFYIILIIAIRQNKKPIKEALFVSFGLILFFILLGLDYSN